MSTEVSTQVNEFGIELTKAKTIESAFDVINAEKQGLYDVYKNIITQEITPDLVKQARELRLKLVKIRTNIASIHKNEKAFYLASGKYIDALKNKLTEPVEIAEEKLSELENYYVNIEKQAKEQRTIARLERVSKYKNDVQASQISDLEDETFEILLDGYEKAYNDAVEAENKRIEAERLENEEKERKDKETKRIAQLDSDRRNQAIPYYQFWSEFEKQINFGEQSDADFNSFIERIKKAKAKNDSILESQRIENERLKKENEQKEEEAKKAKAKADKEKADLQAEIDKKNKAESDRLAKEKADKEAEEKALLEAQKAPTKEKLTAWINEFSISAPFGESDNTLVVDIIAKHKAFKAWAIKEIEKL